MSSTFFLKSGGYIIIKDDSIDKTKLATDVAGAGMSQAAGGELDVNVDGSTIEISSDILQVKANVYAAYVHNHDATYIVKTVDGTDLVVTAGELALKNQSDGFTEENYVKAAWSLFKNVDYLDQMLHQIALTIGGTKKRIIFADSERMVTGGSDAAALPIYVGGTAEKVKVRTVFLKKSGDNKLYLHFKGIVS